MAVDLKTTLTNPALLLMTGFASGLAPKVPGTAGSVVGAVLFIPALWLPIYAQFGVVIAGLIVGIVLATRVADELNIKDPAIIVWDEFVGMWIVMLWLPNLYWLPVAFLLFRLFDIAKPWPVSWADRELHGGLGIMMDDVIAGVLALASLQLIHYVALVLL